MASAQSSALRSSPGYGARPSSTAAFTPDFPAMPTLPAVPAIDDARAPNYVQRNLLSNQLGQLGNQQNAAFTQIRSQAKQALSGYGGWKFADDDPNTAAREDLLLSFDPKEGMGEKEKGAYRGARDQANAAGMLESSFANQNIAQAVQRMSLEAQQIATQYAASINQTATQFSQQAASIVGEWANLYGADSLFLAQNPPQTPSPYQEAKDKVAAGQLAADKSGNPLIWKGAKPPNMTTLRMRYPGAQFEVRKMGGGGYVVVMVG